MRKIGLLTLLIYLIQTVHGNDNNTLTTTNELFQLKLDDLVLVNALAYNKSGNINALSWSLTYLPNASNATLQYRTQYYLLVAASVTTFQVWNGTIVRSEGKNQSEFSITQWNIAQLIPSTNIAHAVAFSPNGKWMALGNDDGTIQIWFIGSQPWNPIKTATIDLDGKIRSLSWHRSSLLLGVAGIKFGFVVIDGNRNWTRAEVESRPSSIPTVADTYVHFMDWSPTNAFVVDTTVYEIVPPVNISNIEPKTSRAVTVLDACRLCTLSQWSPDGQSIATAFGSEISISQVKSTTDFQENATTQFTSWELVHNLTTVKDTYMTIMSMEWSPDGKYLAVGGAGNYNLFVYHTRSWSDEPIMIPTSTKYGIDSLSWRPDSQQIAIGTSRIVEIREIRLKEVPVVDSSPSPITLQPYHPTSAPIVSNALVTNTPSPPIKTGMGTAGMAAIGIAAVVLSFSCVTIVFLQRLKLISKRKKGAKMARMEDQEIGAIRDVENTMSEEDFEFSSPIDSVIVVPRTRNTSNDDAFTME